MCVVDQRGKVSGEGRAGGSYVLGRVQVVHSQLRWCGLERHPLRVLL